MACDIRLKKEKDFALVFKKGKKIFSSKLTLVFVPATSLKVGFAVGKKYGGSVKRNRIKRILRESFRSFTPQLCNNFFFVFIPKIAENYDFNEIKRDMEKIFIKGGFFCNKKTNENGEKQNKD